MPRLTIGMTVFDAFRDAQYTIQALRMYHIIPDALNCDLLVIDNRPGEHGQSKMLRAFCEGWSTVASPIRYLPMLEPTGTSQPRNRIFAEAQGEIVLCMDAHVHVVPGAIKRLVDWFGDNPGSMDLVTGPILWDNLKVGSTHWNHVWGDDAMLGQWSLDPRGENVDDEPFEIPGMGLGLFACRKEAWLGFHPDARGFGGEEMCYHEKVRQAGHKTLCLPFLRWWHKFTDARFEKPAYPLTLEDKAANYVLWFRSLGWDLQPAREAFVGSGKMSEAGWLHIVADPVNNRNGAEGKGEKGRRGKGDLKSPLPLFTSSPLPSLPGLAGHKERIPQLQGILATCRTVTEMNHRRGNDGGRAEPLGSETDFLFIEFTPPVPEVLIDLLDTLAKSARQYIALHDTHWPGLGEAVSRWCGQHREWSTILHRPVEPGITLLRRERNYVPPPGFGPGTELKELLESIGIKEDPSCDCNARMEQMDRWGVNGCRQNRETIVGWLKEGKDRWGWREKLKAAIRATTNGLAFQLSLTNPYGSLVDNAISLAEKSESSHG